MGEKQRTKTHGPTVHISVFIPSGDAGVVPARGVFSARVPMTPEIRAFLSNSVDQGLWKRAADPESGSWTVVEAAIDDRGRPSTI